MWTGEDKGVGVKIGRFFADVLCARPHICIYDYATEVRNSYNLKIWIQSDSLTLLGLPTTLMTSDGIIMF